MPVNHTVQQLFDLGGKTALVVGGAGGVGLQIAYALGQAGARIMLTAHNADALELAVADLQSVGIDARWVAADCAQDADMGRLVDETLHRMGDVDILVNNAAPDAWGNATSVTARSCIILSQQVAQKSMIERRCGRIINVIPSANGGNNPATLSGHACLTAKDAILDCTRVLAAQWGQYGITVNAIDPLHSPEHLSRTTQGEQGLVNPAPSQRECGEDSLKGACLLFASEAGKHITGQCLALRDSTNAVTLA